MVQINLSRKL